MLSARRLVDVPQFNAGLTLQEAMACLAVLATSTQRAGLTITAINPDHANEKGQVAAPFLDGVVHALADWMS